MTTQSTDIEIGTELFKYLRSQQSLTRLLSEGLDEDGQPIVSIYRGNVPQYDQFVNEVISCKSQGEVIEITASYQIDDFLVFEIRDEEYEVCINGGGSQLPETIFIDVQIVSDSLPAALKIKREFVNLIRNKLNRGCGDGCEAIRPQYMCGLLICDAQITGAQENTQRLTSASDFGLTALDLDLQISPAWSR